MQQPLTTVANADAPVRADALSDSIQRFMALASMPLAKALIEQELSGDGGGFVYISGPYSPRDEVDVYAYTQIDANINSARQWAARLAMDEIPFFCPHLNSAHLEAVVPFVPRRFWLDLDMRILSHAAVLFLLPGWRDSVGAREELTYAQEVGMPIYTSNMYMGFVKDWKSGNLRSTVRDTKDTQEEE